MSWKPPPREGATVSTGVTGVRTGGCQVWGGARQRSTRACHPSQRHRPPVPHAIETLLPYPSNSPLCTLSLPPPLSPLPQHCLTTLPSLFSQPPPPSLPSSPLSPHSSGPSSFFMQGGREELAIKGNGGGKEEGRGRREGEEGRKTVSLLLPKSAGADVYDCQGSKILTAWIPVFPSPHVMINPRRQPSHHPLLVPLGGERERETAEEGGRERRKRRDDENVIYRQDCGFEIEKKKKEKVEGSDPSPATSVEAPKLLTGI